jgi:hypothetical protein
MYGVGRWVSTMNLIGGFFAGSGSSLQPATSSMATMDIRIVRIVFT